MNNVYKYFAICIVSAVFVISARAADNVVERVDCASLTAQIAQMQADGASAVALADLQEQHRANCMRSTSGRRTSGRGATVNSSVDVGANDTPVLDDTVEQPDEEIASQDLPAQQFSPEQVAQFIADGKCADGTMPNKFGCCANEKFTDLGNLVFACCVDDGECFPPIK